MIRAQRQNFRQLKKISKQKAIEHRISIYIYIYIFLKYNKYHRIRFITWKIVIVYACLNVASSHVDHCMQYKMQSIPTAHNILLLVSRNYLQLPTLYKTINIIYFSLACCSHDDRLFVAHFSASAANRMKESENDPSIWMLWMIERVSWEAAPICYCNWALKAYPYTFVVRESTSLCTESSVALASAVMQQSAVVAETVQATMLLLLSTVAHKELHRLHHSTEITFCKVPNAHDLQMPIQRTVSG